MSTKTKAILTITDTEDEGVDISVSYEPNQEGEVSVKDSPKSWQLMYALTRTLQDFQADSKE